MALPKRRTKLSETIKIPAMHHEGEEFVHGPEMHDVPDYLVFIVDDLGGPERLAISPTRCRR
ncbi:MAG: hypothetical protein ACLVKA_07170 [Collinsella aerofaciens]